MLTLACYRVAGMYLANFQSLSSVLLSDSQVDDSLDDDDGKIAVQNRAS